MLNIVTHLGGDGEFGDFCDFLDESNILDNHANIVIKHVIYIYI